VILFFEILAPKKIYTRKNPDPEPTTPLFDPEKLLHKKRDKTPCSNIFFDRTLSLPKDGVKGLDDLEFDIKFEQILFRSKLNPT
jgi:hypothetical protein